MTSVETIQAYDGGATDESGALTTRQSIVPFEEGAIAGRNGHLSVRHGYVRSSNSEGITCSVSLHSD